MSNFHISKDGTSRKCSAQTPDACRATKSDFKEHFETREDAQNAYELQQMEKKSATEGMKKNGNAKKPSAKAGNERAAKPSIDQLLKEARDLINTTQEEGQSKRKPSATLRKKANQERRRNLIDVEQNLWVELIELEKLRKKAVEANEGVLEAMKKETDVLGDIYDNSLELKRTGLNTAEDDEADLNTRISLLKSLERENAEMEKEIKKVEKSGRLKAAFNAEFKQEKENKLKEMNERLTNNQELANDLKADNASDRMKETIKNRQAMGEHLAKKGYKKASGFQGVSMSLHPQGPKFAYQCPDCYSTSQARLYNLTEAEDTGFLAACQSCGQKIIIPVTRS